MHSLNIMSIKLSISHSVYNSHQKEIYVRNNNIIIPFLIDYIALAASIINENPVILAIIVAE